MLQTLVRRCFELRKFRSVANRELARLRIAQSRLLPQKPPTVPGYALSFRYEPFYYATGDYLGFYPRPDSSMGVFVGDGSGHGPSASMLMATVRACCTRSRRCTSRRDKRQRGSRPGSTASCPPTCS